MDYNSESLRVLLASHGAVFRRSRLLKGLVICSVFIQDGVLKSFETHTTKQIDAIVPSKSRTRLSSELELKEIVMGNRIIP